MIEPCALLTQHQHPPTRPRQPAVVVGDGWVADGLGGAGAMLCHEGIAADELGRVSLGSAQLLHPLVFGPKQFVFEPSQELL